MGTKVLVPHTALARPLAAQIRATDNGIQLEIVLSETLLNEQTGALKFVDYPHNEIHEDNGFFVKGWTDITGAGTQLNFLWVVPNTTKWPHSQWRVDGEAEFTMTLYEGTVTSNDGTPVAIQNHNRNSSKTPGVQAFVGPTVTNVGTAIWAGKIGSGKDATQERATLGELIGRQNTKYLYRIVKEAAGTEYVDYTFSWYEHTNEE